MAEIIEEVEEYTAPDEWAGIRTMYDPRRQQELDELSREFFMRGGVATWLPPEPTRRERKNALYYASKKVADREAKREGIQKASDLPMVERIKELIAGPVMSRAKLNSILGISDSQSMRLFSRYLKDDPRAEPYLSRTAAQVRYEADARDTQRLAQVNAALEIGIRGWDNICRATQMTHNTLQRIVTIYGLNIRKTGRKEEHAA